MATARRDDVAATLRAEAESALGAFERHLEPDGDAALALAEAHRVWTTVDLADKVLRDVGLLDTAVAAFRDTIYAASVQARHLFPARTSLLRLLACTARLHISRFPFRLDLADIDEAEFLADQVVALADEAGEVDAPAWVTAAVARAGALLWRHKVSGDADALDEAIRAVGDPVTSLEVTGRAVLAECLLARARASRSAGADHDVTRAKELLAGLLDPEAPLPSLRVLPWLETEWAAMLCQAHLVTFAKSHDENDLLRALHVADQAIRHTYPSTAEAESVHLAAQIAAADASEASTQWQESVADAAEIASAAAGTRRWHLLTSSLTFAEWQLPLGRTELATSHALMAYDIVDQVVAFQAGHDFRRSWLSWLTRATQLAVPATAGGGAPGAAASRLDQARLRTFAERFQDETSELANLPDDLRAEVADPITSRLAVLRDPQAHRSIRVLARDDLFRALAKVRESPGFERFLWKLEPGPLLETLGPRATVFLTPGVPAGVAVLGGGALGDWRSVPLPACTAPMPDPVSRFVAGALTPSMPAGMRRRAIPPVLSWLRDAVWRALAPALEGASEVWLVPCGYLGLLPLHAAPYGEAGVAAEPALSRWDIRYAVTARSLARAAHLSPPRGMPMFVGIPEPAGRDRLPGADEEVRRAARWFSTATVLDADTVTPTSVAEALQAGAFLHAACHGVADNENPSNSGLDLGPEGRLTLDHVSRRSSGLELSVLSACETNVPRLSEPDEAMSLAVGMHLAGSRGVIASSWRVPDVATSHLMGSFYERWRGAGPAVSVTQALRDAQQDMASSVEWSEPYYWAGFSFMGVPTGS